MFDNLRTTSRREPIPDYRKRGFQKPKDEGPRMENNRKPPYPKKYEKSKPERNADERPPIRCFGCNEPGVIRAKCPRCSPQGTNETARFGNIQLHSCTDESPQVAVLRARVNGIFGTVHIMSLLPFHFNYGTEKEDPTISHMQNRQKKGCQASSFPLE
ncbi:hypothetical protein JTE90_022727 [Oedothorax gibbosus]|uniref:CCHC-type domain-containing protein n=1 Tax=Oedothorax gibbosus TaxID=931172 RepID=A0AAV6UPQ7_9ARAC|nr:hypothetical protein JTE90_022727 [Oedothorax gibbosus]